MLIKEISRQECLDTVSYSHEADSGCSFQDQPYVVPIYFAYEGEWIYVFSTFGKKIEWMRANPKVCVEIEEKVSESESISVLVNGLYEELAEPQFTEERAHARQLLGKKHHWWLNAMAERRVGAEDQQVEPMFFRIHVDRLLACVGEVKSRQLS
jgi:nitroimidazol reductase NimA-like FMN-containing flavoprotein (pyridoxamine 5'-phosphate oxidase superfamily)